jgi:hypothetical protein
MCQLKRKKENLGIPILLQYTQILRNHKTSSEVLRKSRNSGHVHFCVHLFEIEHSRTFYDDFSCKIRQSHQKWEVYTSSFLVTSIFASIYSKSNILEHSRTFYDDFSCKIRQSPKNKTVTIVHVIILGHEVVHVISFGHEVVHVIIFGHEVDTSSWRAMRLTRHQF